MTAAYFEDHPTDPDKVILRKPTMMWEGSLHIVCECDKCKAQSEQKPMHPQLKAMLEEYFDKCFAESAPQRTWVNMTAEEVDQGLLRTNYAMKTAEAWRHGVEWAQFNLMRKNMP